MERTRDDNKNVQASASQPNIAPSTPTQMLQKPPLPASEMVSPPPKRLPESEIGPTKNIKLDEEHVSSSTPSVQASQPDIAPSTPNSFLAKPWPASEMVSPPPKRLPDSEIGPTKNIKLDDERVSTPTSSVQVSQPDIAPSTPNSFLAKPWPASEMVSPPPKRLPDSEMGPTKNIKLDEEHVSSSTPSVQVSQPDIAPSTPNSFLAKPWPASEMVSPPPKRLPDSEMGPTKNIKLDDERVSTPTSSVQVSQPDIAPSTPNSFLAKPWPASEMVSPPPKRLPDSEMGPTKNIKLDEEHVSSSTPSVQVSQPDIAPSTPNSFLAKPWPASEMVSPPPKRLPDSEMGPTKNIKLDDERVSTPTSSSVAEVGAELAVPKSYEFVFSPPRRVSLGIEDIDQELKRFGIVVNEMEMPKDDDDLLD